MTGLQKVTVTPYSVYAKPRRSEKMKRLNMVEVMLGVFRVILNKWI